MIVPMQRVTVLCTQSARQKSLETLQRLGVLHFDRADCDSEDAHAASLHLAEALRALTIIEEAGKSLSHDAHDPALPATSVQRKELPKFVLEMKAQKDRCEAEATVLAEKIALYEHFGEFSPADAARLIASGICVNLFRIKKSAYNAEHQFGRVLSESRDDLYGVAFEPLPESAQSLPLPEISLHQMERMHKELIENASEAASALGALASRKKELKDEICDRTVVRDFFQARESMGSSDGIVWLSGFCPADKVQAVRAASADCAWAVVARDPSPGETPPTLLSPPRLFRPITLLLDLFGIAPGYRESDVSVVFYAFFSLFFAMLIGDAGYGTLIFAGTCFAHRRMRQAPSTPFILLYVFSITTIVWGILTATYFGIPSDRLPQILKFRTSAWLGDQTNIMQLCFLLGAIHLSIARLWNAVAFFPAPKFLSQLGWVGIIWTMYCTASLVIVEGFVFPEYMKYLAILSIVLVAFFSLSREELKTDSASLAMLPLTIIGVLGDIISYVRLFAVGLASVKVAEIFNEMALSLSLPLIIKIPCVALILLVGHGLNLAMGALSILVHAVRLNTLEFSNHKGISWSGIAYKPLKK